MKLKRSGIILLVIALIVLVFLVLRSGIPVEATPMATPKTATHPLDPLTADEINTAFTVLKASPQVPTNAFFPYVVLNEPPKDDVLNWKPGKPFQRQANAQVFDRPNNRTYVAIIDLKAQKILSFQEQVGVQPSIFNDEYYTVDSLVHADPQWQAAMHKRGIQNTDNVYLDVWAKGNLEVPGVPPNTRISRVLSFLEGNQTNPYNRPIEGVIVIVDLNRMKVLQVLDETVAPVSRASGDPDPSKVQSPLNPLILSQPNGPSYQINGNEVHWQNWTFRYAFNPRDGLVLYEVGFSDQGKLRSILYRASLSEVFVPYALTDDTWAWRGALDMGEYGFGRLTYPLTAGVDVPENATILDTLFADEYGGITDMPAVMAIYERPGGLLWKRVDPSTGAQDSRLGRDLVVYSNATLGNYQYGLSWIFHEDGSIDVENELTGTVLSQGVDGQAPDPMASPLVAKDIAGPIHQHFFNYRLDFDIDQQANNVIEMNVVPSNDGKATFMMTTTPLTSAKNAVRDLNPATSRMWMVVDPSTTTKLGYNPGYGIMSGDNALPLVPANNPGRQRAGFVDHQFWVTPYDPNQMYATGPFPNQGQPGEGLPGWAAADGNLVNKDVVVWYTMGITHLPTVENYPVMSTHRIGFSIMPVNFFADDPALYVPASTPVNAAQIQTQATFIPPTATPRAHTRNGGKDH
jgi:primary-amine oxidase